MSLVGSRPLNQCIGSFQRHLWTYIWVWSWWQTFIRLFLFSWFILYFEADIRNSNFAFSFGKSVLFLIGSKNCPYVLRAIKIRSHLMSNSTSKSGQKYVKRDVVIVRPMMDRSTQSSFLKMPSNVKNIDWRIYSVYLN